MLEPLEQEADELARAVATAEAGADRDGIRTLGGLERSRSAARGSSLPDESSASGRLTASSRPTSNTGSVDSGTATVTYPASARNAASAASIGAPVKPGEPPTTSTEPARYFVLSRLLRGTSDRIVRRDERVLVRA